MDFSKTETIFGTLTAYFSLSPSQLENFKNSSNRGEQRITRLLAWPRQLLITIVIGNTMVNISIASLAVILTTNLGRAAHFNQNVVILLDVVVVTFVILILSEILPKVVAVRNAKKFSVKASLLLLFIYFLFYPVTYASLHQQAQAGTAQPGETCATCLFCARAEKNRRIAAGISDGTYSHGAGSG
ncbi:hypothetical protein B1H10_08050 [candidate division KSB1 bacterium 4484_188]|nr:MAG: hypothetical protein B1H10_08050 [candidate division KSB1 bacterium 4484_188]